MPSRPHTTPAPDTAESSAPPHTQVKVCADCSQHLPPEHSVLYDHEGIDNPEDAIIVCEACHHVRREQDTVTQQQLLLADRRDENLDDDMRHCRPLDAPLPSSSTENHHQDVSDPSLLDTDTTSTSSSEERGHPPHPTPLRIPSPPSPCSPLSELSAAPRDPSPSSSHTSLVSPVGVNTNLRTHQLTPTSGTTSYIPPPDPYLDITRLRVRPQTNHCLYSGATFRGVQKNGRSSYDVTVTIVDLDFSTSFLCGYLEIRGLTEDWPTLTTYFDAEIIGPRFGFRTQTWGATEQDDMTHWNRFPCFRSGAVQSDLQYPGMTLRENGRERGCLFMRWKERFLVPDHRVTNISGASFAGFYYVCVEFNPKERLPISPPTGADSGYYETLGMDSAGGYTASMSGFYFHQNSEPYQQLSLHHVPTQGSGYFEFR